MRMPPASSAQRGFTLIELMIGMAIGVLSCIAIAQVMSVADGYRRGTASGSDAQVVGGVSLFSVQREIEMSGYGLTSVPKAIGCPLSARYGGAAVAGFANVLAPAIVTPKANGPDAVRLLSSNKPSYSVPNRLIGVYDPQGVAGNSQAFLIAGVLSNFAQGDLMVVASQDAAQTCEVFQINGAPTAAAGLPRLDDNKWNGKGFPDRVFPANGEFVVDLGTLRDVTFTVEGDKLVRYDFDTATRTSVRTEVQSNVVNLKVFYGVNSKFDGSDATHDLPPDTYTTTAPTNNIEWQRVRAIRLAVVVRTGDFDKAEVSSKDGVQWVVGGPGGTKVDGAVDCGTQKCLTLKTNYDGSADYLHYRYKVFDTVVPLRNMVWHS